MTDQFTDSVNSNPINLAMEWGQDDSAQRHLWRGTRQAIEADGLEDLEGPIGKGGMGLVFLVREKKTQRKLVVKVLDEPGNEYKLQQFRREHKMLASEAAPLHVVPHLRYWRESNAADVQPYLVMEWIDGQTVYEYAVKNDLSIAQDRIDAAGS